MTGKLCVESVLFVLLSVGIGGCQNDGKRSVSDDLAVLRSIVRVPDEVRSARWEIFGTPEYKGGVPGPTDYVTLVAELETTDDPAATPAAPEGNVAIVPEAARPWLSNDFRTLLDEHKNTQLPMTAQNACRPYRSAFTKTGKPVDGFICGRSARRLLYLTLQSN